MCSNSSHGSWESSIFTMWWNVKYLALASPHRVMRKQKDNIDGDDDEIDGNGGRNCTETYVLFQCFKALRRVAGKVR